VLNKAVDGGSGTDSMTQEIYTLRLCEWNARDGGVDKAYMRHDTIRLNIATALEGIWLGYITWRYGVWE